MTHPDHLADEELSALVDGQLAPDEIAQAQAHLGTCSACQARLEEMHELVGMLRSLPSVEPPRDFRLGPRLVVDPPNVIRLRRWYAWSRVGAGALAAVFVFLSVGTLYVDSRPGSATATLASKAQPAAPAPAAPNASGAESRDSSSAAPAPAPAAPAAAARPAAVPAASPAAQAPGIAAAAPAVRSQAAPAPTGTEPDQIAAATTVRPLPTQAPTPMLLARPAAGLATSSLPQAQADPAAPLRIAAAIVGVLAACGILLALFVRHRLQAAAPSHPE